MTQGVNLRPREGGGGIRWLGGGPRGGGSILVDRSRTTSIGLGGAGYSFSELAFVECCDQRVSEARSDMIDRVRKSGTR